MVSEEKTEVNIDKENGGQDNDTIDKNELVGSADSTEMESSAETEKIEEEVEMVEIPVKRFEELENAEAIALEEIKRERASVINYRKRLEKQRDEFAEIASARVLSKVLQLKDDLNRILDNGKEDIPKEHLEGIQLMSQRIKTIFEQEGVTILEVKVGKTIFDPRFHEPILAQPNADLPNKTITTVVNVGFMKGDRVLRPAKVIITQKPQEPKPKSESSSGKEKEAEQSNVTKEDKSAASSEMNGANTTQE